MSNKDQNLLIARLIVGAMQIDGVLDNSELERVISTLTEEGLEELVADVGTAMEEDLANFNMFKACKELVQILGEDAKTASPIVFRVICDVVANDRFVSLSEATYLSAMAKRLELSIEKAKEIFKGVMSARRSRLEQGEDAVDGDINPHLKALLSFEGSDKLVGELEKGSLEAMLHASQDAGTDSSQVSNDELEGALGVLGLGGNAKLEDATTVWRETIDNLQLSRMADLGETFVTAAINRMAKVNSAYKTIVKFHQQAKKFLGQ